MLPFIGPTQRMLSSGPWQSPMQRGSAITFLTKRQDSHPMISSPSLDFLSPSSWISMCSDVQPMFSTRGLLMGRRFLAGHQGQRVASTWDSLQPMQPLLLLCSTWTPAPSPLSVMWCQMIGLPLSSPRQMICLHLMKLSGQQCSALTHFMRIQVEKVRN